MQVSQSTPEQEVPPRGLPGVDWETCMTMNESWGFHRTDTKWKSAKTLIRMLAETASKGGNFLLNVGPTELGEIPAPSVERLRAMGAWMRVNAPSIYGTGPGPIPRQPWGRSTMKEGPSGSIVYLHIFDWPEGGEVQVPGLLNAVRRAYLLANPSKPLAWSSSPRGIAVSVPSQAPDASDSVLVLELVGHAAAVGTPLYPVDGAYILDAADAAVLGEKARYESEDDRRCIGHWKSDTTSIAWDFRLAGADRRQVEIEFACEEAAAGSEVKVELGGSSMPFIVTSTGDWGKFERKVIGVVDLKAGKQTARVVPVKLAKDAIMNLRSIRLIPDAKADGGN
jgi:alpha-L-fucosidase